MKNITLALAFALVSAAAFATDIVGGQNTTLYYDSTNSRIGVNAASPRGALEVSPSLVLSPVTATPTATVTGTIAMNASNTLVILSNTTAGTWAKLLNPTTTATFVPAN